MEDPQKMRPRPFRRNFFPTFDRSSRMPLRGDVFLMSFKGMGKSIQTIEASVHNTDAPAHRLDEFPAGYSLTGCSPALPVSASPTDVDHAAPCGQVREQRKETLKRIALITETV